LTASRGLPVHRHRKRLRVVGYSSSAALNTMERHHASFD
jgi:hypothetical protein